MSGTEMNLQTPARRDSEHPIDLDVVNQRYSI